MIVGNSHPLETPDGYEFDLFVSYSRSGNVPGWVHNHLAPLLDKCLADNLPWEPRVFLDVAQEPGTYWRANLRRVLGRSRILVAVWSPRYFTSDFCLAEWRTMCRRQEHTGLGGVADPRGLVFPFCYTPCKSWYPKEALEAQCEEISNEWGNPSPAFADTVEFHPFRTRIAEIAGMLAPRLDAVPDWQADWPVEMPEPEPARRASVPRL